MVFDAARTLCVADLERPLFHFNEDAFRDYDVTPDGKRFHGARP
jgi:hypothetical protein